MQVKKRDDHLGDKGGAKAIALRSRLRCRLELIGEQQLAEVVTIIHSQHDRETFRHRGRSHAMYRHSYDGSRPSF